MKTCDTASPWADMYSVRGKRIKSSAIRELLKVTEQPDFVSFAGGFPAPELFPVEEISEVTQKILAENGQAALQYSATEGYRPLREWAAEEMRKVGVPAQVENIIITTGSQQALDLVGRVVINKDDPVAVESPTYLAALQAWRGYGARFLQIPSDSSGLSVEGLKEELTEKPKLLYAIPNFQNPSGSTLSLERRGKLVEWCEEQRVCLVEDDPYRVICFDDRPLPRLMELESARRNDEVYAGRFVYLTTFSKVLAPGLRVGLICAHPELISKIVQAKQASDLHTPTLNQMICYEMAKTGFLNKQAKKVSAVYKERMELMYSEVLRIFPDGTQVSRPSGGMFLWITLPEGMDADDLWKKALNRKVAFVPGAPFFPDNPKNNTLRLNYSNSNLETIKEGMSRVEAALNS